jgi:hypothetical protein
MPLGWGIRKGDEECASERKTDKPLGGGVKPPRDAGRRAPLTSVGKIAKRILRDQYKHLELD